MLARYTSEPMAVIWSDEHKIELWHQVEVAVVQAYCRARVFPAHIGDLAAAHPAPTVAQVHAAESVTHHDVAAFLRAWTAGMPAELGCRVHRGLTSSDVVDTALAIQLAETSKLLGAHMDVLVSTLRDHALAYLDTPRIGRTHGQHATADTWGHRIADFAAGAARGRLRLAAAAGQVSAAKISGPTGVYENVPADIEADVAAQLGLRRSEVSSQIVLRDRIASWMCELAQIATLCEAIATEVRLGQLSEIGEVYEPTALAQVGSSAMPHKRNPIRAEKICGLARVVRGYLTPVLESVVSWQQRDISHSSVERVCLPDASGALEHVLAQTIQLIAGLSVGAERMSQNLVSAGEPAQSHRAVVVLSDRQIPYIEAHDIVATAIAIHDGRDLADRVSALCRSRGHAVDASAIRDQLVPPPPDLSEIREFLSTL